MTSATVYNQSQPRSKISGSLRDHRNLFWQLSRDGNLRQPLRDHPGWRRGRQRNCWMDNVKEWIYPYLYQSCSQCAPAEKTWRGSLLNRSLQAPPTAQSVEGHNWTKLNSAADGLHLNWPSLYIRLSVYVTEYFRKFFSIVGWMPQGSLMEQFSLLPWPHFNIQMSSTPLRWAPRGLMSSFAAMRNCQDCLQTLHKTLAVEPVDPTVVATISVICSQTHIELRLYLEQR